QTPRLVQREHVLIARIIADVEGRIRDARSQSTERDTLVRGDIGNEIDSQASGNDPHAGPERCRGGHHGVARPPLLRRAAIVDGHREALVLDDHTAQPVKTVVQYRNPGTNDAPESRGVAVRLETMVADHSPYRYPAETRQH